MTLEPTLVQPILSYRKVTRYYGREAMEVRALGPITVDINRGEFIAIMGPSGSGKSTMLSLAGALDRPTAGQVSVDGHDLAALERQELADLRRRTIGYVFQDLNLLPGLTAIENVALPLELDGMPLARARHEAREELERVGIGPLTHRFPDDLSGGEQQRVAIARAFVGPRSLLLADEPTGALDSVTGESIMRLLRSQCARDRTVVLVTHDSSHAAWADRVLFLRDGVILEESVSVS